MASTDEKRLESNFVKWCKDRKIIAVKGPAPTAKGIPDRIVPLPHHGGTIYVEFKGNDSYYGLTPMQEWWKTYLQDSDPQRYFIVDTDERLEKLKHRCEEFMAVGQAIVEYENKLLKNL